jgi:iron complex transport system ATP-binding protein
MTDSAVRCRDLRVNLGGKDVVDGIDLDVTPGDWVAVVGPNGAGKTTLMHALAGLIPSTGELSVGGLSPRNSSRKAMSAVVALMPQRPVVPEGSTVQELVALGRTPYLRRFGTETATDRSVISSVIERLDLTEFADRRATELSGGELQRVVLARALAQEPQVLLLDEPTSALDIGHQQQVLDLVEELREADNITVIAAMHDLTLAGQYGRRIVLLDKGSVVADGTPSAVPTVGRTRSALALPAWPPCRVKPSAGTLLPWWTTESCWTVDPKYRVPRRDSVARWHTSNTSC